MVWRIIARIYGFGHGDQTACPAPHIVRYATAANCFAPSNTVIADKMGLTGALYSVGGFIFGLSGTC
ncbi:MAG: hypothetical protein P8P40_00200 [Sulfitobacter sp.]|nr:hypothetical protein [Sulfitobacter sp.]MDG1352741.1 hypothetical protein [Sulfitobacter sp.]